MSVLAPSVQAFFTDRLIGQRCASPNTIAAYKTTFRLLLNFLSQRTKTKPSNLDIDDLGSSLVSAFLEHLETDRHNGIATRNNRLAAIHSLFAYLVQCDLLNVQTEFTQSGSARRCSQARSGTLSRTAT